MDLQLFLAINLMSLSALAILLFVFYRPAGTTLWIAVHLAVLAVGAAALIWLQPWAGFVVTAVFVPFVLIPSVLSFLAFRRAAANRMTEAALYATWAARFHPSPHLRFVAASLSAQTSGSPQARIEALRALAASTTVSPAQRLTLKALELRQAAAWPELVELSRANPNASRDLQLLEIRALGECGRLGEMIDAYETIKARLMGADLASVQLIVMAFNGRPAAVERLLEGELRHMDGDAKTYWRAVAARGAGDTQEVWHAAFEDLARSSASPTIRQAAEHQLDRPPPTPPQLTPFERAALQDAEHWIISRPLRKPARPRHVPMTFSLIALNLAAFAALEMSGGSQDIMTAVRFGAMWPPLLVEQGEWWRLLSALFLHFGPLHLSINMLLLFLLGRDCESRSGSVRFLVVYLMGGVSSSAAVLALMWYRWTAPAVLIGASGAIFALIGFEVANRLLAWLSRRDAVDSRGLIIIAIVLVVQFGIDLSLPQVSLGAHASGFVAGMVLGSLMHRLRPQQA